MSATLNGLNVVSVRCVVPYRGAPFFDVDVDPASVALVPKAGPAVLIVGSAPDVTTINGVVDPRETGSFVSTGRVRVVGGRGGWDKAVPAQHFHLEPALPRSTVLAATASEVLETVVELVPQTLGTDFVRSAGPASRVFGDAGWWVDPATGTTFLGPRAPAVPPLSLELLEWDPKTKTAVVSCDTLIVPGTVLVDARIGESPVTVRDVDQTFDAQGSRAILWCADQAVSRLSSALTNMVRELGGVAYLKTYRYRFVAGDAGHLALQAVERAVTGLAAPMPDLIPLPEWSGLAGATAVLPPGLEVLVQFVNGDPSQPVVVGYATNEVPLEVDINALVMKLGATAASISMGPTPTPLAKAVGVAAIITALEAFCTTAGTAVPLLAPACTTLSGALAAAAPTVPTLVVKGT